MRRGVGRGDRAAGHIPAEFSTAQSQRNARQRRGRAERRRAGRGDRAAGHPPADSPLNDADCDSPGILPHQPQQSVEDHLMPTRHPNSLAAEQRLLHSLLRAADERRMNGQYAVAEPLYLKALALAESAFGSHHLEVSVVLNNLAVLYKYTGNFDKAE